MSFSRYAVYVTFPPGPLASFVSSWLGWDAATGTPSDAPDVDGLPAPPHELSATPRKYGAHGTIKPPFRLADGQNPGALMTALEVFCAARAPVVLQGLELNHLGGFLALTVRGETAALDQLAAQAVSELDRFRGPPSEAELAKRRSKTLSPRQEQLLHQWGYPYVMEEFRFHITLTGRVSGPAAEQIKTALAPVIAPLLPQPFVVDALTLCGEDAEGQFHELHRCALVG